MNCDQCGHDLAEHDEGVRDRFAWPSLVCHYVVERHDRAVDDFEDELCRCGEHGEITFHPEVDRVLTLRWHLAKAAYQMERLKMVGERERLLALAEAVKIAREVRP